MTTKSKEKSITITTDVAKGDVKFAAKNLSLIEILGLLRLYEKKITLELLEKL